VLLAAALAELANLIRQRAAAAQVCGDPNSPWNAVDPWWLGSGAHAIAFRFAEGEAAQDVALRRIGEGWRVDLPSGTAAVRWTERDGRLVIVSGTVEYTATVVALGESRHVFAGGTHRRLRLIDPLAHAGEVEARGGHLIAPMSGTVIAVMVKVGDRVAKGAPLVILEAMKMEHTIVAPADGVVSAVNFRAGDRVGEGADLVDVDAA
jgi:3-methylcrotonyl-CoA carboxylase alpha subunit